MKKLFFIVIGVISFVHAFAQQKNWNDDAELLHRAQKALTVVIVHDVFSPNVAGRIYVYANFDANEALVGQQPKNKSLYGQLPSFHQIPAAVKTISPLLSSVYAFLLMGKKLIFSEPVLQDSINPVLKW